MRLRRIFGLFAAAAVAVAMSVSPIHAQSTSSGSTTKAKSGTGSASTSKSTGSATTSSATTMKGSGNTGTAPASKSTGSAAMAPAGKGNTTTSSAKPTASTQMLDINTASADQLKTLPGVGDAYAARIVQGRPYTAKNQLTQKGIIPQATYDKIKDQIVAHRAAK